jgi:hypothetical protein
VSLGLTSKPDVPRSPRPAGEDLQSTNIPDSDGGQRHEQMDDSDEQPT